MLASLFIPYQFLMEHPANLGEPWMTLLVYFMLFLFPTVPMVAALLIYQGYKRRGKRLSLAFFLAAGLLLAKVTFNIYWLIVWDNTGNSLDFLWLISPLLGAVFAGLMLFVMLNGRAAWAGISYLVLIPALFFGAYRMAEQVDVHDLTQQRAARASTRHTGVLSRGRQVPGGPAPAGAWLHLLGSEPADYGESGMVL